jgi:hypothetical protein
MQVPGPGQVVEHGIISLVEVDSNQRDGPRVARSRAS